MPNFARILYHLALGLRRLNWSKEKLKNYQDLRVRAVVRYAYDFVPFYHRWFNLHKVSPFEIQTVEDLAKVPVVGKDEFRRASAGDLVSREYDISRLKVLQSSGSTGKPFRFLISKNEDDWRKAIYLRANISCGQHARDKWVFITAPRHFGDTTGIQRKLGVFAQTLVSVFDDVSNQLDLIRKNGADIIDGYSGALFLVAKEAEREGANINPALLFGSSDSVDNYQRRFMEKVFGAPYLDQYGCSEVNRVAWQCPLRDGYHLDVDSVITQFVDEDGENSGDGEEGEVVLTSLFNFAMPFIRYSLGDIGQSSNASCSCGRVFPLMQSVKGRRDSFVILPDGRVFSPRILTVAMSEFRFYRNIDQFRIVQRRKDLFDIYLKLQKEYKNTSTIANELIGHLSQTLRVEGLDVNFNVQFVEEMQLSNTGRLRAVFSEVN